jgi:signal transduction histidine kinase/ActR/RegA family two-component response regulator
MINYLKNVFFMLTILLVLLEQAFSRIKQPQSRMRYVHLVGATAGYVVMDCAFIACYLKGAQLPAFVFQAVSFLFYVIYVCLPFVWHLFVRNFVGLTLQKRTRMLECIPLVVLLVMILISGFTGILWTVTDDCTYIRGPLFNVYSAINLFYYAEPLFYLAIKLMRGSTGKEPYLRQSVLISLIPLVAVIANSYIIPVYDVYPFQPFCCVLVVLLSFFTMAGRESDVLQEEHQKELQAALVKAQSATEAAEEADRTKTEFLQRMSHDVRTPLNGICGMLDIAERFPNDLGKQVECRQKVRESSNLLLELVNEVLDMSKLNSGQIVLEQENFNIMELSREVNAAVCRQAAERDIEIVQQDCKVVHKDLVGSAIYYKRLMMNIISNAIKYNKDHGKIYITCRETACDGETVTIEFKCRDTGIGMSPEFQRHIFEPFAQEHSTARTRYNGTGLGMAITKEIVDKMGGTITFESTVGEGTTFDIFIPFAIGAAQSDDKAKEDAAQYSVRDLHILLVEDVELNMEIAQFLLEEAGAQVTRAWNGQEAVDAFKAAPAGTFDLILMDVMMPVMDGYQATRCIRGLDRPDAQKIPIVAMTANAFAEDKIAAREAGMNEHISKPLDAKQMVKIIATLAGK